MNETIHRAKKRERETFSSFDAHFASPLPSLLLLTRRNLPRWGVLIGGGRPLASWKTERLCWVSTDHPFLFLLHCCGGFLHWDHWPDKQNIGRNCDFPNKAHPLACVDIKRDKCASRFGDYLCEYLHLYSQKIKSKIRNFAKPTTSISKSREGTRMLFWHSGVLCMTRKNLEVMGNLRWKEIKLHCNSRRVTFLSRR